MLEEFRYRSPAALAVGAIMEARGVEVYDTVEEAPVLDHPDGDMAVLVRFPDAPPEILVVSVDREPVDAVSDTVDFLKHRRELYSHASRRTDDLLRRYAHERDRTAIETVLRRQQEGVLTREQAAEALGLRSVIDLVKLQFEFRIHGTPGMVDAATDMMSDIERGEEVAREERAKGTVPTGDYVDILGMRRLGLSDEDIRGALCLDASVPLPTAEEIEVYTDRLVYGIAPDTPPVGVTVTVRIGPRAAKVLVEATDGVRETKVAFPRMAGENAGRYVDDALERLRLKGDCPPVEGWSAPRRRGSRVTEEGFRAAGTMRVRPLRWTVETVDGRETHMARSPVGDYAAWEQDGRMFMASPTSAEPEPVEGSVEDVKAKASADHEGRVREALEF